MFKRLLVKYKLHNSVITLVVFFCLFILSGCGVGMGTAGSGQTSGYDSGEVIGGDSGGNSEVTPVDFIKLSWMAPTSKADGSTLTNLGGYAIYYRNADDITQIYSMHVGNVTSATIDNLSPGIWCFAISAYNDSYIESELSNYACKEI
jgi:hypothetical protein